MHVGERPGINSRISQVLDGHCKSLVRGMQTYRKEARSRIMHGMRTDMKTLRSVFFLLEETDQHHKARKLHRRLKKIFAAAGRIREYQLEEKWLRRHRRHALRRLLGYAGEIERNNADFQAQSVKHVQVLREIVRKGRVALKAISPDPVYAYLSGMLSRVREDFHAGLPIVEWHDLRKHLKRLLYARSWIAVVEPSQAVLRFMADLEVLQSAIGNWHDLAVMEARLHDAAETIRKQANAHHEYVLARRKLSTERQRSETRIRKLLTLMGKRWGVRADKHQSRKG